MTKELKVPNLGENISSAEVLKVLVKVGDKISKEQSILEISSDKATIEIPSDLEGTVKEIKVKEGDSISEGDAIFVLDDESGGSSSDNQTSDNSSKKEEPKEETAEDTKKVEDQQAKQSDEEVQPAGSEEANETSSSTSGASQFTLPNLGENIASAEVLKVLVKVGDKISKEQSVLEISSDKATLEVPSDVEGVVKEIKVKEGDSVKEGDLVLELEGGVAQTSKPVQKQETKAQPSEDKNEAPKSESKEPVKEKEETSNKQVENAEVKSGVSHQRLKDVAPAAPSVRRFAREIGIDIHQVPGSGEHGRISIEDVKNYSKDLNKNRNQTQVKSASPNLAGYVETLPDFAKWGEVSKEQMNNVRFKTAQHLSYAWNAIPHVTHFEKVNITELEKLRKSYGKKVESAGGKLTMTSILIKIIASALKVFPKFAASIDMEKKEIIYKKYTHIGLAVDTDRGLLVPVIKDADKKNVTQISVEVGQAAQKARDKKLTLDDMSGAVFSISNLGGIGGVGFTPVVNSPEVAILGVSQSSYEPVYNTETNTFEPKLIMPLSLSYDHRLIDGADAARFMKWVKEAIENPFLILLEG